MLEHFKIDCILRRCDYDSETANRPIEEHMHSVTTIMIGPRVAVPS